MTEGEEPVRIFLGLGSNIRPETHLPAAVRALGDWMRLTGVSQVFRTAPIDRPDQPAYRNTVLAAETVRDPDRLRREVLRPTEAALGRKRTADPFAARTIDIDLLLYGDMIRTAGAHPLPDPDIRERPFLAAGLLDLAPGLVLPGTKQPLRALLSEEALAALETDATLTTTLARLLRTGAADGKGMT